MGRGPSKNPLGSRTDLEDLSVSVGGIPGDKSKVTSLKAGELTEKILEARLLRLERQNQKLEFEIKRSKEEYGDIAQIRGDVVRANAVVKHSLYALAVRISDELAQMDDPVEIQQFLHGEFTQAFNNLAYELNVHDKSEGQA